MNKTILIAPFENAAARALSDAAQSAGWTVILARVTEQAAAGAAAAAAGKMANARPSPSQNAEAAAAAAKTADRAVERNTDAAAPQTEETAGQAEAGSAGHAGVTRLFWNPSSYISASALLLAAENAAGALDAAVLFEGPQTVDLLSSAPGAIEAEIEGSCLGPAFLARGLIKRFEEQKTGSILLFQTEAPADTPKGPAACLAASAFRGLGDGLFAQARGAGWQAFGIQDSSGSEAEAARFALRLLEEGKSGKAGRWLRFNGKSGIFGMF